MKPTLLITGPGGRIGREIVPRLREHFHLRLLDRLPLPDDWPDEFIRADILDGEALRQACAGMDAVLHLAAISDEAEFYGQLLPVNLEGVYTMFEAARLAGVPKVIFPSTGQTVLNYPAGQPVTADMPARPSTVYACTKLFGEALARHYAENHGLSILCLRICWFQGYDSPLLRIPGHRIQRDWCSPRDLTQLILRSLQSEARFGIFFGLSRNRDRCWDIEEARRVLGYEPEDDAAAFLNS